jgi:hypothetical protein
MVQNQENNKFVFVKGRAKSALKKNGYEPLLNTPNDQPSNEITDKFQY